MSESEWPKQWEEIRDEQGPSGLGAFSEQWISYQSGMRGFQGTLYVSESIGREREDNIDLWMPFEVYIQQKIQEQCE